MEGGAGNLDHEMCVTRGVFLDVIETKSSRLFCTCYSHSPPPALRLEISTATTEITRGLALFTSSLFYL